MRGLMAKPKEAFFHQIDIWKGSHMLSVKPSEGCGLLCNRTQNKTNNEGALGRCFLFTCGGGGSCHTPLGPAYPVGETPL